MSENFIFLWDGPIKKQNSNLVQRYSRAGLKRPRDAEKRDGHTPFGDRCIVIYKSSLPPCFLRKQKRGAKTGFLAWILPGQAGILCGAMEIKTPIEAARDRFEIVDLRLSIGNTPKASASLEEKK